MKTIPEITLPSNPEIKVRMREATVSDSLDFAGIKDGMEEAVTSLFLEKLQDKSTYTNPKKWTGEDRRLVLFWYWLHTTADYAPALAFDCKICGERHIQAVDLRILADSYKQIKGKPERDVDFQGETIIVRPLDGSALEEIESMYLSLNEVIESEGLSGHAKTLEAKIRITQFLLCLEFPGEKNSENPRQFRENKILGMSYDDFSDLSELVTTAIDDLEHGLLSVYEDGRIYLLTPPVPCQKEDRKTEVGTQLRLPFRNYDYIPTI